jgi:hypothetical protein
MEPSGTPNSARPVDGSRPRSKIKVLLTIADDISEKLKNVLKNNHLPGGERVWRAASPC